MGSKSMFVTDTTDGISHIMAIKNMSAMSQKFNIRYEKVTDITGTTSAFAILQQFYLNRGNTVLFPIFSKIAATYERYKVNVLKFHFATSALSASGSNVSNGRLLMATSFDVDAGTFTTKNQMENYGRAESFAPFTPLVTLDVLEEHRRRKGTDFSLNEYWVNGSANQLSPVTGIGKLYDIGNFQLAGNGNIDSTSQLGELWVEFAFEMIDTIQDTPLGDVVLAAKYTTVPVSTVSRFLTGVQQAGSNMSLVLAANTITLPFAGNFFVFLRFSAATSYTDTNAMTAGTNGTLLSILAVNGVVDTATGATAGIGSGGITMVMGYFVSCTAPNVVLTYAGTPTIVGTTAADVFVCQVPSDIITFFKKGNELSRIDKLETLLGKMLKIKDDEWDRDWQCRSYDMRKPEIPSRLGSPPGGGRAIEDDAKSVSSQGRYFGLGK